MKRHQLLICLLIFLTCLFVYFANGEAITSNDDVPTSLLGFNWLENHALNFDVFRDNPNMYKEHLAFSGRQSPYYFIESENGHLSAKYPIGPALVSFPIYAVFFLYTKAQDLFNLLITGEATDSLDLLSDQFLGSERTTYETIAATITTGLTVVLFYLASRLKFGAATAIWSSFIFAFSTSVWSVGSQGLRQHTVTNLVLMAAMLALLKANRTTGNTQRLLIGLAGFFAGLFHASRPTSLLFFVALIFYCVYVYRKECIFFFIGSSSILFGIAWNVYYFGWENFIKGGYAALTGGANTYSLSFFPESFLGLLFSPSRGWLVLCPVLLFAIPGIQKVSRWKAGNDEKLLGCLTLACLALFVHYWFYFAWPGVLVYGPSRFLIDVLPVMCFLINYFISDHFRRVENGERRLWNVAFVVFASFIVFSTFVQTVGLFSDRTWAAIPTANKERLWDIRDSQVERAARGMFFKIRDPIANRKEYLDGLSGEIVELRDENDQPLADNFENPGGRKTLLKVELRNTGTSNWFGYETGTRRGLALVSVDFRKPNGDDVVDDRRTSLWVGGTRYEPGETAIAIGEIKFPREDGDYVMHLQLSAAAIGDFPGEAEIPCRVVSKGAS